MKSNEYLNPSLTTKKPETNNSNKEEAGYNQKLSAENDSKKPESNDINCLHISQEHAINALRDVYRGQNNLENFQASHLKDLHQFWQNYQTAPLQDLRAKISQDINYIIGDLIQKNILANPNNNPENIHTIRGLELLRDDLLRRAGTEFINQIPNYIAKFIKYILILQSFDIEKQRTTLIQFPPDSINEYQCNDGAKSRLNKVYEDIATSSILLKSHNIVAEEYATKFRINVDEGNHPHVLSFVNYLLGVEREIIAKIDNFYLTPNNKVSTNQFYELIISYKKNLSETYLNLIKENKSNLIQKIIKITNQDNSLGFYGLENIKKLLVDNLDIDENYAEKIAFSIFNEFETKNKKLIYWLTIDKTNNNEQGQNIIEVLEEKISEIIAKKQSYFDEVNKENENSIPLDYINLNKINELREIIAGIFVNEEPLNLTQKNAIFILRVLAEKLLDYDPVRFLVASDFLFNKEEELLQKLQGDIVLINYVNRIYECREIYLGKNTEFRASQPLFNAILTKDCEAIKAMLQGFIYNQDSDWIRFIPNNEGPNQAITVKKLQKYKSYFEYVALVDDKNVTKSFLEFVDIDLIANPPVSQKLFVIGFYYKKNEFLEEFLQYFKDKPEIFKIILTTNYAGQLNFLHNIIGYDSKESIENLFNQIFEVFANDKEGLKEFLSAINEDSQENIINYVSHNKNAEIIELVFNKIFEAFADDLEGLKSVLINEDGNADTFLYITEFSNKNFFEISLNKMFEFFQDDKEFLQDFLSRKNKSKLSIFEDLLSRKDKENIQIFLDKICENFRDDEIFLGDYLITNFQTAINLRQVEEIKLIIDIVQEKKPGFLKKILKPIMDFFDRRYDFSDVEDEVQSLPLFLEQFKDDPDFLRQIITSSNSLNFPIEITWPYTNICKKAEEISSNLIREIQRNPTKEEFSNFIKDQIKAVKEDNYFQQILTTEKEFWGLINFTVPTRINELEQLYRYRTPLQYAAENANIQMMEALIENGAKIDAVNDKNKTALHYAFLSNNQNAVICLLENHANDNVLDYKGRRPSEINENFQFSESILKLLEVQKELKENPPSLIENPSAIKAQEEEKEVGIS